VNFSYSPRWSWGRTATFLQHSKRSKSNRRTWWRRWSEMSSSSASVHGNPDGIAVSMQKGSTSKLIEAREISVFC
jgi:hypothetical protein